MTKGSVKAMLLTIGHSNHDIEFFLRLLTAAGVSAIGDVRSSPYSRYVPQYTREALKSTLAGVGIAYTFLGKEFGARSENPLCYKSGKVQYDRLVQQPIFGQGITRVIEGMKRYRIALMCAEKDPIECHRALLVARTFFNLGISVSHIHKDGFLETHDAMESRLLVLCKMPEGDMFKSKAEFIAEAYMLQGDRVAYHDNEMTNDPALES